MKLKQLLRSGVGSIVAYGLCGAVAVCAQSTLNLDIGSASTTIDKALYGVLMENYGRCIYGGIYVGTTSSIPNTNGMRNDVIEGFKEAGVGCIEWPGGCFADQYHGTAMPQSSRPGGENTNGLGTPEFFKLCSLTTALPYPTANIQSGTSAEMNAWLTYIHDRPDWWNMMKHWKIGNEEWDPCGNMTQSSYQTKYDQWYDAEPEWARSSLMHIMDGGSGGGWVNADATYAQGNSGPMGISFHRYSVVDWNNKGPSSGFSEAQYYSILQTAWGTETSVKGFSLPGKVALCVDEWGAWYNDVSGNGTSFNWSTVRDAVIAGMHLNIFNNRCERVKMALVAQPVNVIQALMLTNPSNPSQMRKTPVFWVFKMFKPHQGATMVPATMTTATNQGIPVLNASASINAAKALNISIVNTHATGTQSLTINCAGATIPSTGWSGQIVNGASITSGITSFTATDTASLGQFTDFTVSGNAITTTLPAHSVVMLSSTASSVGASAVRANAFDAYSINATRCGKIIVTYAAARKTPVRLTLYGIDGRAIMDRFNGTFTPGHNHCIWQPKRGTAGTSTYIVKMESGGVTKSRRVVLTRS
jgi:alpha-N-arabinofuranosidase